MKKNSHIYLLYCAAGAALLAADGSARADYPTTVLGDGPLAYYRFSETVTMPALSYASNLGSVGSAANGTFNGVLGGVPGALSGSTDTATTFGDGNVIIPYSAAIDPSGPFNHSERATRVAVRSSRRARPRRYGHGCLVRPPMVHGQ